MQVWMCGGRVLWVPCSRVGHIYRAMVKTIVTYSIICIINTEVEFIHPVSPGGSVKFVASSVNFSIFTNFLCFFLLKLLKLGEIGGVKFLTWKSGVVKFWTNSMSGNMRMKTIHTFWEGCNFNQDGLFNLIKTVTCTKKSNVPGNTQRVNDRCIRLGSN